MVEDEVLPFIFLQLNVKELPNSYLGYVRSRLTDRNRIRTITIGLNSNVIFFLQSLIVNQLVSVLLFHEVAS